MDFSLSEEHLMIRDAARKVAHNDLEPNAALVEDITNRSVLLSNLRKLAELGFMGLNVSARYGGSEVGVIAFALAMIELGRGCAATAVTVSVTNMVAEVIQACGSEEQKQYYLPKLCSGEYSAGAFCLSEAGAGSDPSGMQCKAVRDGEGWVINGSKIYITSGAYAGVYVVWAVTDPQAPKGKGISCFLVEGGTPGVTVGKEERKMGQRGSATNEIHFSDCRVPASAMMGKENDGFRIAVAELAGGRIGIGSMALGIGLAAVDHARAHMHERAQFGKPLEQMQGLQWMLADTCTDLEAARLLLMQAAWYKENGKPYAKQAAMAKLFATEKANQACYFAQQIFGGSGYVAEFPVERLARDVRVTSIYEGTSEIQRLIIAREILAELDQN